MKYGFMQKAMWTAFKGTFSKAAVSELGVKDPKKLMKAAHSDYKRILAGVDEFDKGSRFLMNILSCADVIAILMNLDEKPSFDSVKGFYSKGMTENFFMKKSAKMKGNVTFTEKGRATLKAQAELSMKIENPYDWKFSVEDGETMDSYTATFYTCGICKLMNEWGFGEYVPAMCAFDYDLIEMENISFAREYVLATGGSYCDCHYSKNAK